MAVLCAFLRKNGLELNMKKYSNATSSCIIEPNLELLIFRIVRYHLHISLCASQSRCREVIS